MLLLILSFVVVDLLLFVFFLLFFAWFRALPLVDGVAHDDLAGRHGHGLKVEVGVHLLRHHAGSHTGRYQRHPRLEQLQRHHKALHARQLEARIRWKEAGTPGIFLKG